MSRTIPALALASALFLAGAWLLHRLWPAAREAWQEASVAAQAAP